MPKFDSTFFARLEWPTIGLIALTYVVIGSLVWFHASLPWWVILPLGAYAACLHSSLQHEVLHGHPTRSRYINEALIFISPQLWLPYGRYRDLHLAHHNDMNLTCPVRDPESYYVLPDNWDHVAGWKKSLYRFNNTLFGRMLIGPLVSIIQFWSQEFMEMGKGRVDGSGCWFKFAISTALVLAFVHWCGMPIWQYILLIAYPSISLALVRSYCEHQAAEDVGHRTIIVEASPFWALLFLNNNLHIAHHERPSTAWYKLPEFYAAEKQRILQRNGHYLKMGYGAIFRAYLFTAKEEVAHPNLSWLKPK
ncbi:fatty acid desaturase [Aestuariivirga litoralis]|uniref:fatty acid desaturase n=1 Tax=Aestuariivirga litoralis TaxID=2650924 RepID=UPI0018C66792|nr:fatty acid desaturase [Aestuariivirga litoralis]MBG1232193.1 fatty acid desaturase [Aestuariivirga litoralis]